jgi:hypothetical protein
MNFQILCKTIESRVSKELASSMTSEEMTLILTSALYEFGNSVLPALLQLLQRENVELFEFENARDVASDLLTFLALPFIQHCTDFKQGIATFDDLSEVCPDRDLRCRIIIYTNQLKKRRNQGDPFAFTMNPRATRPPIRRNEKEGIRPITLLFVLGVSICLMYAVVATWEDYLGLGRLKQSVLLERQVMVEKEDNSAVSPSPEPPRAEPQSEMPAGDFYRFTDRNGVIHMVDDPDRIPPEYRNSVIITRGNTSETPVKVTPEGHVLVPVTLSHRGRSVRTTLILDTGATTTSISEETATELGIMPEETSPGVARVADGRKVMSRNATIDSVRLGSKELRQTPVSIMPYTGPREDHDGLLGMSFLKAFAYQVDLNRQKIIWR